MNRGRHPRPEPSKADSALDESPSRLDSWKEIASYLGRSEKTVRRWETGEALPIHRLLHEKRGSVYAYTGELDAWRGARKPVTERDASFNEAPPQDVEIPKHLVKGEVLKQPGN